MSKREMRGECRDEALRMELERELRGETDLARIDAVLRNKGHQLAALEVGITSPRGQTIRFTASDNEDSDVTTLFVEDKRSQVEIQLPPQAIRLLRDGIDILLDLYKLRTQD